MSDVAAGWYDDGAGRQRWWDGSVWTEELQDEPALAPVSSDIVAVVPEPASGRTTLVAPKFANAMASRISDAISGAPGKITGILNTAPDKIVDALRTQHDYTADADALWSATSKPLTGVGVGRYKLTAQILFFERGTLTTRAQQINTNEIYDVDASQTLVQKARGVGSIRLHAVRANGARELVEIEDVASFREGVGAINTAAQAERERLLQRDRTSHQNVNYTGGTPLSSVILAPSAPAQPEALPAPAPAETPATSLNEELAKLAELRSQGFLDDEEFKAAKRVLLGL